MKVFMRAPMVGNSILKILTTLVASVRDMMTSIIRVISYYTTQRNLIYFYVIMLNVLITQLLNVS